MDTLGYKGIAIVRVFVCAGCAFGIAAGFIMHMMGAYGGSPRFHVHSVHRCAGHGKQHRR